eukprot:GHVU01054904.1.p1 GENE.GHVU01054904.1~~GHVU01054904.1.p1  ORF type:complete len:127 (-),score=0.29 GHVU01054904.1:303-683(-)
MVQRVASTAYCSPKRFAIVGAASSLSRRSSLTAVDAHMHVYTNMHARVHPPAYTHPRTYIHACMRVCAHTHAFANEPTMPPMPTMPTSAWTLALQHVRTHTPITRTVIRIYTRTLVERNTNQTNTN